MMKPMLAMSIAALGAVCLAMAPQGARAGGPCADSCDLAGHMAAMHAGMAMQDSTSAVVAMNTMPGMSGMGSPAPASSAKPAGASQGAAADAMLQTMNDTHMAHGPHMQMTMAHPTNAHDKQRSDEILAALRTMIEPFKDYRAAQAAGYAPFMAQVPQEMYHFTNYANAYANEFSFDPARPTSLMYKRVPGGYQLVGAMYTAPARFTDEQLNARVPLSIATWHLHTNLCLPPVDDHSKMWGPNARFGLAGSITTASACEQAGGTFKPVIYNWMVHVWPLETDPNKVWASEEHPGAMDH